MKIPYSNFDLDTLHNLFRGEEDQLAADLLRGTTWQEARERRGRLSDIAEAIYQKYYPGEAFERATFKYNIEQVKPKIYRSATFLYNNQLIHFNLSIIDTQCGTVEVEIFSNDQHFLKLFRQHKDAFHLTITPLASMEAQCFEKEQIDYEYADFLYSLHEAIQWVCFGYAGDELEAA